MRRASGRASVRRSTAASTTADAATTRRRHDRDRDEWLAALRSTASAWARAYAGLPLTQPERALSLVATDLEPLAATRCQLCRKALEPARKGRREYCSDRCRKAKYMRENGG
jgi:hypothetical protein